MSVFTNLSVHVVMYGHFQLLGKKVTLKALICELACFLIILWEHVCKVVLECIPKYYSFGKIIIDEMHYCWHCMEC